MSTKAIRKALRDMQCDYNPCLPGMCRKHDALSEVEAIEKAAKVFAGYSVMKYPNQEALRAATQLMEAIAKEAP